MAHARNHLHQWRTAIGAKLEALGKADLHLPDINFGGVDALLESTEHELKKVGDKISNDTRVNTQSVNDKVLPTIFLNDPQLLTDEDMKAQFKAKEAYTNPAGDITELHMLRDALTKLSTVYCADKKDLKDAKDAETIGKLFVGISFALKQIELIGSLEPKDRKEKANEAKHKVTQKKIVLPAYITKLLDHLGQT